MTPTSMLNSKPHLSVARSLLGLVVLGSMLMATMLWGPSAQAELTYQYKGQSFGPNGLGAGEFFSPGSLAVDQGSGDVFVYSSEGTGSISKFTATGTPVDFSALGSNTIEGVGSAFNTESEIAVDSSSGPDAGDIYIANNSVVRIYSAAGSFLGQLTGGETCGVAVDSSGAVYVGVYPDTAKKYTPVTNPVTNADETSSIGGLEEVCNVAVDSLGNFYAATYSGGITRYDALQLGSLGAAGTKIDEIGSTLTVDPSTNDVYVDDRGRIAQYDSSGTLLANLGAGIIMNSYGLAIKSGPGGDLYVQSARRVDILEPAVLPDAVTGAASGVTNTGATVSGTVNPNGIATTYQFEYGTSVSYGSISPASPASAGSDATTHSLSTGLTGLAASTTYHYRIVATNENGSKDGLDETFHTTGPPAVDQQSVGEISHTRAKVGAEINPGGFDTHYQVEYGTSESYGSITPPVDIGSETSDESVSVELTGLQPGTRYHFRVVATNSQGPPAAGPAQEFVTFPITRVDGQSFSGVTSMGAVLNAQVDDFGLPSTYFYEYGTSSSYGSKTPEISLGSSEGDTGASILLSDLQPDTTYHFRIVVTNLLKNEESTVVGADGTLTTLSPSADGLPDERIYEMVSPPENQNANVYVPAAFAGKDFGTDFTRRPIQASLDGSTIAYVADPTSDGNGSSGDGGGNQYVATRSSSGWRQESAQPSGNHTATYQVFTSDVSTGFLDACSEVPLSASAPAGGYDVLYSHAVGSSSYVPLLTSTPPNRFAGEFGSAGNFTGTSLTCKPITYAGSSSEESHVLFEANDALTPEGTANPPGREENDLYDSAGGRLNSVNVLPGSPGQADPNATFGSRWSGLGIDYRNVISSDGSRIFWTDLNTGDLYVREDSGTSAARTVQVDASVGGGGSYWTANSTGSLVFFTKAEDLYAFDTDTGQTTDLAPEGRVQGVVDASEDGSYVYYVAEAALAAGASVGQPNLYLRRLDGAGWEPPVFIATLSSHDYSVENSNSRGIWLPVFSGRTAEATPNGHNLVFSSHEQLTGYKSQGAPEVYIYDADTGGVLCVSCDPSGEAPTGEEHLPVTENSRYMLRWISASGERVFFNDSAPLVPEDTNGVQDVYEWERNGAGGCKREDGCLFLLSGGNSTAGSYFVGTSVSGDDAFMVTRAELVVADQNDNLDLYDAHAGGARQPSPPACSGSGCQGVPPAPPIFATPSSVTFTGVGNFPPPPKTAVRQKSKAPTRARRLSRALKACSKKPKGRRAACRALARKRYRVRSRAKKSTKGRK